MFDGLLTWIRDYLSDDDADEIIAVCPKVTAITPATGKVAPQDTLEFQVETTPGGRYDIASIDLSGTLGVEVVQPYNTATGRITLKFVTRSLSAADERIIVAEGGGGRAEAHITVSLFQRLWNNHPGRAAVCDDTRFPNQCAMRMGVSFEESDISIPNSVRKCTNQYGAYADHRSGKVSGHVLAAQELANWIDASGIFPSHTTAISEAEVGGRTGIIFFLNGWGTTDHIDVWNGTALKGGSPDYFDTDYDALWFWEIY